MPTEENAAARVKAMMEPFVERPGGLRELSIKSGLSEMTLRKIATTGVVSSHRTAAILESATGGAIEAAAAVKPGARGTEFYSREPARTILRNALERGVSVTDFLLGLGITQHDLWVFMNHGDAHSLAVKNRVRAALRIAGMPVDEEDA